MALIPDSQLPSDLGAAAASVPPEPAEQTVTDTRVLPNGANAPAENFQAARDEQVLNELNAQKQVQQQVIEEEDNKAATTPFRMALIGHRPKDLLTDEQKAAAHIGDLYDYTDEHNGGYAVLHDQLKQQIATQLKDHRQVECHSGMALGMDTVWAHAIVNARQEYGRDRVKFVADIPCGKQESMWRSKDSQARYRNLLSEADTVNIYDVVTADEADHRTRNQQVFKAMMDRDRGLVQNSDLVLAVYNDAYKSPDSPHYHKGSTFATLKDAYLSKKKIMFIDPAKAFENAPERKDAHQIFNYDYNRQVVIPFDLKNPTLYERDQANNVAKRPFAFNLVNAQAPTVEKTAVKTASPRKKEAQAALAELQINYAKLYTSKNRRLVLVTPYTRADFDQAGVSRPAVTNYVLRNEKQTESHQTTMTLTNFNKLMKSTKNEAYMLDQDAPDGVVLSTYRGDKPIPIKARFQGYRRDEAGKFVPSNEAEIKSTYPDQHLYYAIVSKDAAPSDKELVVAPVKPAAKNSKTPITRTVEQDNSYKELFIEQAYLQMSRNNNPYVSFVPRNRADVQQEDAGEYPINTKYRDHNGETRIMHNSYVNLHWFNEMMRVSGNPDYMIDQNNLHAGTVIGKDDSVPLRARVKLMTKDNQTGNWRALTVNDDPNAVKTKRLLPNTVLKTEFPDFDREQQRELRAEQIKQARQAKDKAADRDLSDDEVMAENVPF